VFGLSGRAGALDAVSATGADMAVEAEVVADVDRAKECSVFCSWWSCVYNIRVAPARSQGFGGDTVVIFSV